MGIRFECPNGHHLNVKGFLAGKTGICPDCDARFIVPSISGRRVEAIVEAAPPVVAPIAVVEPEAPALEAPAAPEINVFVPRTTLRNNRRDERLSRAKKATMWLSLLVAVLLVVMVIVLVR